MTSLFEHVTLHGVQDERLLRSPGELPVELMPAGGRGVSLLDFASAEAPPRRRHTRKTDRSVLDADFEGTVDRTTQACAAEAALELTTDEARRALDVRAMIDAARAEAAADMRAQMQAEVEARLTAGRGHVAAALSEVAGDRERYFLAVEGEIVRLALAIAGKVLLREVFADPMHLLPLVRAALTRVQDDSTVEVCVPSDEVEAWQGIFSGQDQGRVQVHGSSTMAPGECVVETQMGRVELGVAAQLGEIERWFGAMLQGGVRTGLTAGGQA